MPKIKRFLAVLLAVLTLSQALVPCVFAEDDEEEFDYTCPVITSAEHVYFYNFENDVVLAEQGDMNVPIYPGATVKVLAGITAIEALGEDTKRGITVTDEMLSHVVGNKIGFLAGEVVNAEQMLYAMIVNSANDAAVILAYIVAGSLDAFVDMMNDKALEIGARSSNFTNPTGMHDEKMTTTLGDVAVIAKHAYENSYFMEIASTQKYVMDETNMNPYRNIYNRNCLLSKYYRADYYYENALGMSAGNTSQAGYTMIGVARNNEGTLTYLCIIMGAKSRPSPEVGEEDVLTNYTGAIELFDWALRAYDYREVMPESHVVCEVPVSLSSTADYVTLVPENGMIAFLPTNIDLQNDVNVSITVEEEVDAPVKKGQVLGQAKVIYNDTELGRVPLVATSDVERSEFLFALARIKKFTSGKFFITAAIAAVVLTVAYVLGKARMRQKRLRSRVPQQYKRK